jgi:hypothetical protein
MALSIVAQNIDNVPVLMEWHEVMCAKRLVDFCNNVLITMLHTILSRTKEKQKLLSAVNLEPKKFLDIPHITIQLGLVSPVFFEL